MLERSSRIQNWNRVRKNDGEPRATMLIINKIKFKKETRTSKCSDQQMTVKMRGGT